MLTPEIAARLKKASSDFLASLEREELRGQQGHATQLSTTVQRREELRAAMNEALDSSGKSAYYYRGMLFLRVSGRVIGVKEDDIFDLGEVE